MGSVVPGHFAITPLLPLAVSAMFVPLPSLMGQNELPVTGQTEQRSREAIHVASWIEVDLTFIAARWVDDEDNSEQMMGGTYASEVWGVLLHGSSNLTGPAEDFCSDGTGSIDVRTISTKKVR
jgi:hypothetical protein